VGIEPLRAETGYGYIETGDLTKDDDALHVRRFTEKPNQNRADEFVSAGNYYWNSGMFLWSARTLANAVRDICRRRRRLESIAAAFGTPQFEEVFHALYPKCENISVDYAVLEPRSAKGEHLSHLYCLPAEFSWNDLGSWASLYEYQLETRCAGMRGQRGGLKGAHGAGSDGQLHLQPEEVCCAGGRGEPGDCGYRGCVADSASRSLAGCGQDCEGAQLDGRSDLI